MDNANLAFTLTTPDGVALEYLNTESGNVNTLKTLFKEAPSYGTVLPNGAILTACSPDGKPLAYEVIISVKNCGPQVVYVDGIKLGESESAELEFGPDSDVEYEVSVGEGGEGLPFIEEY